MNEPLLFTDYTNPRDEIVPNLWIGQSPSDVSQFEYVICCKEAPHYNIKPWQTVIVAPFDDVRATPPDTFLHNLGYLAMVFSNMGPTLVHCHGGINRSALVVALALMKSGMTAVDAIELVRAKRARCLLQNETFEQWLHDQDK